MVSPLLDSIIGNLVSAAMQNLQLVWGADVQKELQNLMSTLSAIQAALEDAEERQFHSKAVKDWLQKLKYIAYDADDLVDEIVTEARQSEIAETGTEAATGSKKRKWRAWDWLTSPFNSSKRNMASRIREIHVRLDKVTKERRDLHLEPRCGGRQTEAIRGQPRRLSSSVKDESSQFLSREDDKEQIVKFLLSDDPNRRNFSIISIVGMGGVGKTTLAGVIYNDKRITQNFEIRAWVCVSEHFDVERLTKEIITAISKTACDLSDIDSLQCCLQDKLNGKKFLLVLDDVWSENGSDWELLQAPFSFGAKGSKTVVTTRSQAVSDAMEGASTHHLKCLSQQDCWSLFVNQAFYAENADAYPELMKLGEELVNKCGGLPLAVKALGGVLSSKRQVREWENILKSSLWSLPGIASNIIPVLRLSYQYLPAHLKRCFTFCSVFPKDYEFNKEKLAQQWVAHGFVSAEEGKQIEDTSSGYFNDLLQRSFFQLNRYDQIYEERTTYKMHDLIHDLAQFISGDECFHMENGMSHGVPGNTRHLSYFDDHSELMNFESFYESKGLRTFIRLNALQEIDEEVPHDLFERLRFIRVLDLNRCKITELPKSIGNLKHLRYLDLSGSKIKELPESICSICNLETLLLRRCYNLVMLPSEMRKLINLRHLDIAGCRSVLSMPPQIGRLTCLQTLPLFYVGIERERGIAELKELTSIRGVLRIEKLENVAEAEDARDANLKSKSFIDVLLLNWSANHSDNLESEQLEKEIASELRPHPNLKRLGFWNYMGTQFPSWMVEIDSLKLFSNLRALSLGNCSRCSVLPPLGCLSSLSDLFICRLSQVKRIGWEFYGMAAGGFPALKELRLEGMGHLEEWMLEDEGAYFPSLERILIGGCPQLRQIPNFKPLPMLTFLSISNCARLVSLPPLPCLKELHLSTMENLEEWCDVVGKAHFPHLQQLSVIKCPKIRQWPDILPVLTESIVGDCQGLNELPYSLSVLRLVGVVSERAWNSVSCLTSLSSLSIEGMGSLTSMPRGMLQTLTQLKELSICSCEELMTLEDEVLPLNLTHLRLLYCPNLKSLPRSLFTSSLELLQISGCPALKVNYLKDVGEDFLTWVF